ncbi:MAG: hypothetical protein QOJ80_2971 [Mycobacterium sp.]|nr:hypothetical protein [Mycobacterium sp.]
MSAAVTCLKGAPWETPLGTGHWGEVFGDDVVAGAVIDHLVHHAEVISLKGDSYRIKDRDLGRVPTVTADAQ